MPEEYLQRFPDDRAAVEAAFGIGGRGDPPAEPPATAAHSLLFGLLALQNNFIDRETLLAAFNAWIADKSRRSAGSSSTAARSARRGTPC